MSAVEYKAGEEIGRINIEGRLVHLTYEDIYGVTYVELTGDREPVYAIILGAPEDRESKAIAMTVDAARLLRYRLERVIYAIDTSEDVFGPDGGTGGAN